MRYLSVALASAVLIASGATAASTFAGEKAAPAAATLKDPAALQAANRMGAYLR